MKYQQRRLFIWKFAMAAKYIFKDLKWVLTNFTSLFHLLFTIYRLTHPDPAHQGHVHHSCLDSEFVYHEILHECITSGRTINGKSGMQSRLGNVLRWYSLHHCRLFIESCFLGVWWWLSTSTGCNTHMQIPDNDVMRSHSPSSLNSRTFQDELGPQDGWVAPLPDTGTLVPPWINTLNLGYINKFTDLFILGKQDENTIYSKLIKLHILP